MPRTSILPKPTDTGNDFVASQIRKRIIDGTWRPGMRLPTRRELRDEMGVALATVQRAFNVLSDDGFIDARGAAGTYVADYPPHLCNYGVLFLQDVKNARPGSFASLLVEHCRRLENRHERRLTLYFDADDPKSHGYRQAIEDHVAQRLAGLIFVGGAYQVEQSPLVQNRNVPAVMFHHKSNFAIPAISTDFGAFIDQALDRLVEQGCQSVAVIRQGYPEHWRNHLQEAIADRGLKTLPQWDIAVHWSLPEGARIATHLLMDSRAGRPDGLIVMDDVLIEETLHGLSATGVQPGRDVKIVSHCNFPTTYPARPGVQRLGFDVPHIMDTCLKVIDRQRQGKDVPQYQEIQPTFESAREQTQPGPFAYG